MKSKYAASYQIEPKVGTNQGVFMIHGFASNPEVFRPYAVKFAEIGLNVYVARIAGHGISPEYFATTNRKQWSQSIKTQFLQFSSSMDKIIVMGHSLGALLAIELAVENDLLGLILLAPPIHPKSKILIRFHHLLPFLSHFKKYWAVPKAKVKLLRERGANIYEKHPLVAFNEMLNLIKEIQPELQNLHTKTLMILGDEDEFVNQDTLEILENHFVSEKIPHKKWSAPHGSHALIDTSDLQTLENNITQFIESITSKLHQGD